MWFCYKKKRNNTVSSQRNRKHVCCYLFLAWGSSIPHGHYHHKDPHACFHALEIRLGALIVRRACPQNCNARKVRQDKTAAYGDVHKRLMLRDVALQYCQYGEISYWIMQNSCHIIKNVGESLKKDVWDIIWKNKNIWIIKLILMYNTGRCPFGFDWRPRRAPSYYIIGYCIMACYSI